MSGFRVLQGANDWRKLVRTPDSVPTEMSKNRSLPGEFHPECLSLLEATNGAKGAARQADPQV